VTPNAATGAFAARLAAAPSDEVSRLELLPNARQRVVELSQQFAGALTAQAQARAWAEGADPVLAKHVNDALDAIIPRKGVRAWLRLREGLKVVGGTLLGTGLSGFLSALPHAGSTMAASPVLLSLHAALGMVSVAMIGAGLYLGAETR
jgi:hypothetical protein